MRYAIRVIPRAKRNKVVKEEGRLKVYLTAPPVEGRANRALIEALASYFKVKPNGIRIVTGEKGRDKVLEVQGVGDRV